MEGGGGFAGEFVGLLAGKHFVNSSSCSTLRAHANELPQRNGIIERTR